MAVGMPRYFFNLVVGKVVHQDLNGRVLQDDATARVYAHQNAREMLKNTGRKTPKPSECQVDVTDEANTLLFTVPFTDLRA
jgi:hypothetical protein